MTTVEQVLPTAPASHPLAQRVTTTLRSAGVGALSGATTGALYRAWMRLVSTDPEFSWSGTLFIIGTVTVVGTLTGVAWAARRTWRSRWSRGAARGLGGAAYVLLASGPGLFTLPIFVPAALAFGRSRWPRWLRLGLLGLAGATLAALWVMLLLEDELALVRRLVAGPAFLLVMTPVVLGLRVVTRGTGRRPPR